MKKKLPVYEINIDYSFIIYEERIVSLLSFVNNDILSYLLQIKEKFYCEDNVLRVVPNMNEINQKIEVQLNNDCIPKKILFVYDKDDEYNEEYIYLKEVFSGVSIKVDKFLISVFQIDKLNANKELLKYNLEEINSIKKLMFDVKKEIDNQKIINFPIRRIKE